MSSAFDPSRFGLRLAVTAAAVTALGATTGNYFSWGQGSPSGTVQPHLSAHRTNLLFLLW